MAGDLTRHALRLRGLQLRDSAGLSPASPGTVYANEHARRIHCTAPGIRANGAPQLDLFTWSYCSMKAVVRQTAVVVRLTPGTEAVHCPVEAG